MSGEKLTANEKTQYKLMGVVSLGLDVFTLGTATAAIQGTKAGFKLANAFGKVILTDAAVGWGTKFTSEAMLNIGMSPQLVFAIHIGTNLVVAKHNTTNIKKLKDIEKTLGLKPDQVQDLMKYTGKNFDDFAKAVKNGELDSLLGIPEMNMKYLMKQTGKSADEIADWLKRNDVNLKDINPKNVDDIVNGAKPVNRTKISPEMEEKILWSRRKNPNKNEIIGGHSPSINNDHLNYAAEVIKTNSDGTKQIKFTTQFEDGNLANIKKSTLFPDKWSNDDIINSIKNVGESNPHGVRASDGATLHRGIVNGVQVEVIKIGDNVFSGYPTGGVNTKLLPGFK